MDYRAALITGADIPMESVQVILHQPTVKEVSMIGEKEFFPGIQTLCLYKSMFEDNQFISSHTTFQIFMTIMNQQETADKKKAVIQILSLILPEYKIQFTPRSMLFVRESESIMIDDNSFNELQEKAREIFGLNNAEMDQRNFNPANDKAKEIADKIMRGRQRVAEEKGDINTSVFQQYLSFLAIGLKIPITTLREYTIFQLYDQVERFGLWTAWDIDKSVRLAGGTPDKEPENWMKNIHTKF